MSNTPSLAATLEMLKSLDLSRLDAAELAPMANAIKNVAAFGAALHAEIERRVLGNGEMLPGVVVKDAVVHRKWHDEDAAWQLAQETFGDAAFMRSLKSPAQIEKMGRDGKTFVALASFKPEGGKKVVY